MENVSGILPISVRSSYPVPLIWFSRNLCMEVPRLLDKLNILSASSLPVKKKKMLNLKNGMRILKTVKENWKPVDCGDLGIRTESVEPILSTLTQNMAT